MVQKMTRNCIWVCQKVCWLKNELCCQWQHGIKNDQRLYLGRRQPGVSPDYRTGKITNARWRSGFCRLL
ncbi:hypothetical protein DBK38_17740 [Salmonella enterica subsp. enterica serovar Typhi]|nr:hypothetical protein DBK38_17740 [Salmonella enterica subsp. enterica serovar Typhi]